jgi:multidrug efflux pump subunit AcrB
MIDYVNRRREEGASIEEAALLSGARRFRPILLTSVTTFMGLVPLMLDRSIQAQFLIPMAVSLAFGVMFATLVSLFLVPTALVAASDAAKAVGAVKRWYFQPFQRKVATES